MGSDWQAAFYGQAYDMNGEQLNAYSEGLANGLQSGGTELKKLFTVPQLLARAKSKGIKIPPKAKKADIIKIIEAFETKTVADLKKEAKDRGLKIPSKLTKKADIMEFLSSN